MNKKKRKAFNKAETSVFVSGHIFNLMTCLCLNSIVVVKYLTSKEYNCYSKSIFFSFSFPYLLRETDEMKHIRKIKANDSLRSQCISVSLFNFPSRGMLQTETFFTVWVTDKNNLWSFLHHNQEWNIKGSNIWGPSASGRRSQMDVNREGMWQVYEKQTKMQKWYCRKSKTTKQKSPGKMVNWKQWLSDFTSPVPSNITSFSVHLLWVACSEKILGLEPIPAASERHGTPWICPQLIHGPAYTNIHSI